MLSFTCMAEPHFFLKSCDLEMVVVVLVSVSAVAGDEMIEGRNEPVLTVGINEIKSFEVLYKGVRSEDFKGLHLSTIIFHVSRIEFSPGSMSHYFMLLTRCSSLCTSFSRLIMITFNKERKIGTTFPHTIIKRFEICKLLQIENVFSNRTAGDR